MMVDVFEKGHEKKDLESRSNSRIRENSSYASPELVLIVICSDDSTLPLVEKKRILWSFPQKSPEKSPESKKISKKVN